MNNFLKIGKQKEKEFAQILIDNFGGTITYPSKKVDMFDHIDLYWNNIGFDVKGVKGETRSGPLNDRFHWIEYQNRNGEKGWLNGKAKYFAFETFSSWIIVSKNRIKSLLYDKGNIFNHDPLRPRKLLMHKLEILRYAQAVEKKGYTVVATKCYIKNGLAKLVIALARGKNDHDKRETIKKREIERNIAQTIKEHNNRWIKF